MHASQTSVGTGELERPSAGTVAQPLDGELSPWCSSPGKRALDLVIASAVLLTTWPIMLATAVAIKLSSRGPVLFRQKRVGKNGSLFEVMKFRSMLVNAERSGPGITSANDPRIFPLGRLLRKWKLDELPQVFNVLRGDMSLVGPRPDLPEFCASLTGHQRQIFELRPGITGAATLVYRHEEQILAGRDRAGISDYYACHIYPEKVQLDLDYARRASLVGDFRILAQTLTAILSKARPLQ
jgi:lipopolysaccharide/colanic/teichoic acid biosynthesis glycosyltransferase